MDLGAGAQSDYLNTTQTKGRLRRLAAGQGRRNKNTMSAAEKGEEQPCRDGLVAGDLRWMHLREDRTAQSQQVEAPWMEAELLEKMSRRSKLRQCLQLLTGIQWTTGLTGVGHIYLRGVLSRSGL